MARDYFSLNLGCLDLELLIPGRRSEELDRGSATPEPGNTEFLPVSSHLIPVIPDNYTTTLGLVLREVVELNSLTEHTQRDV